MLALDGIVGVPDGAYLTRQAGETDRMSELASQHNALAAGCDRDAVNPEIALGATVGAHVARGAIG